MIKPTENYEKRFVAFLDVLGFRELVNGSRNDLLDKYFQSVIDQTGFLSDLYEDELDYILISDSIVLSIPSLENDHFDALQALSSMIHHMQFSLVVEQGIWLRGGIAEDQIYIDRKRGVVVGPGLIRAFELEKLANYPRVIVDPKILSERDIDLRTFLTQLNNSHDSSKKPREIIFDQGKAAAPPDFDNDAIFINYLRLLVNGNQETFEKFIFQLKSALYRNQMYYEKYRWVAKYARFLLSLQFDEVSSGRKKVLSLLL